MEYEILLDLVNYQQYTGNIERELTDFIFGSKWNTDYWKVPKKWEGRLLRFPDYVDDFVADTLCNIKGKVYSPEEVKKYNIPPRKECFKEDLERYPSIAESEPFNDARYGLKPGHYEGGHPFYNCFRIFWRFKLENDGEAKKMAEFLAKKTQDFMIKEKDKVDGKFTDTKKILTSSDFRGAQKPEVFDRREIPTEIYRLEKKLVE